MNDFDYDSMQKKRIARGAMNMKRGSKSKKCSLPHDGWTAAQLRRLNGPVSTYKLDEPMQWGSFKAMPEDLQRKYITSLQENYQANDAMMGAMFGVVGGSVLNARKRLGIPSLDCAQMKGKDAEIRDAKWEAFCNGVVGGKPGEPGEVSDAPNDEPNEPTEEVIASLYNDDVPLVSNPVQVRSIKDMLDASCIDIPKPERIDATFIQEINSHADLEAIVRTLSIPEGKCRIRISIERV